MKEITNCPICEKGDFNSNIVCKDYTVSSEEFKIDQCENCEFRFTNPVPVESEIGKYYESEDYISHSNTSKDLISKIYQAARKSALKKKHQLVSSRVEGNKLLDIGCGTGDFMAHCKSNNLIVSGIEPSDTARSFAIEQHSLEVFKEDQLQKWTDGSFDIITLWHVLEHVYPLNERVKEIKRLLTDNGKAFIAVPNCESLDAKIYREYWAAYDVPRHLYHFRKENMTQLWEKHGCQVEEVLPMKLDSYYVSLLSEKYKGSGILAYPKAFISGLRSNLNAKSTGDWSSLIYVISKKG